MYIAVANSVGSSSNAGGIGAPVATAATGVGETSFTANWEAYDGATYYLLDVSTSPSFSSFVYENQQVNTPNTSYVVIGLSPNTTYYYRVRANVESKIFQFTVDTTQSGVSASNQFKLPLTTSAGLDADVYWGDGTSDNITSHTATEVTHTYSSAGTYTIKITGDILGWQFNNGGDKLKMGEIQKWGALNISVSSGFYGCTNMTCSATDAPLITTDNIGAYFHTCKVFNGDIGNWDISGVTILAAVLYDCDLFNRDLGAWDTSNVTSMAYIFGQSQIFNNGGSSSINNWDVSNVTNMRDVFNNTSFNQDISNWDISQVNLFTNFMNSVTLSTTNYDALLVGWEANLQAAYPGGAGYPHTIYINFGGSQYTAGSAAETARTSLINTYGWTITDGGPA